jgi:hypothetical protein
MDIDVNRIGGTVKYKKITGCASSRKGHQQPYHDVQRFYKSINKEKTMFSAFL